MLNINTNIIKYNINTNNNIIIINTKIYTVTYIIL